MKMVDWKRRRLHPLAGLLAFLLAMTLAVTRPFEDTTPTHVVTQSTTTTLASIEELMRKVVDELGRPLCDAPPVTLTKEQQEMVDRMMATLPLPPNVTTDPTTPGGVSNVHRRLVPC